MAFTLTLLGTDTQYTPMPDESGNYLKGETLSFVSTLIKTTDNASHSQLSDTPVNKDNITLINGPATAGSEVGDRIAKGVLALLDAISRGEKDISIIAHSRGAVQALLVAHELQRLQDAMALNPALNIYEFLTLSPCSYTALAMSTLSRQFGNLNVDKIRQNLNDTKLAILNIDPVPGGSFVALGSAIRWLDERFYHVPKIVKVYEQYVYENEHTRCFKAIIPLADSPDTKFKIFTLPGHHGTGSGNFKDQRHREVPQEKGETTHVQQLLILKIMDFLKQNNVEFELPNSDIPQLFPELINLVTPFIKEKSDSLQAKFNEKYLYLYGEILKNTAAYKHFDNTSYVLGQEQSIRAIFWSTVKQRIVHFQRHTDTFLPQLFPSLPSKLLLNSEHARLALADKFQLNNIKNPLTPSELLTHITAILIKACQHAKKLQEHNLETLTGSVTSNELAQLTLDAAGKELIVEGLSNVIEQISQSYLQGLTTQEEKRNLLNVIDKSFKDFTAVLLLKDSDVNLAKLFLDTLQNGFKNTINTRYHNLIEIAQSVSRNLQDDKLQFISELVDEVNTSNLAAKIQQVEETYKNLDNFISAINDFQQLEPRLNYQQMKDDLEARKLLLAHHIANYMKGYNLNNIKPMFANIKLCDVVFALAISMGAVDPKDIVHEEIRVDLQQQLEQKQRNVELISQEKTSELSKMEGQKFELVTEINALKTENAHTEQLQKEQSDLLIKALNSPKEGACFKLIKKKLLPCTEAYLKNLQEKIQLSTPHYFQQQSNLDVVVEKNDLIEKYEAVSSLYSILTSIKEMPLPSQRVQRFYESLDLSNEKIQKHRDPEWKRYLTNTIVAAGIIMSGVLPGLLLLGIFAKMRGTSAMYWQSQGQTFFKTCKDEALEKADLVSENNKPSRDHQEAFTKLQSRNEGIV